MLQSSLMCDFVWPNGRQMPSIASMSLRIANHKAVRGNNCLSMRSYSRTSTIYSFLKDLVLSHEGHIQRDEDVLYCKFLKSNLGLRRMRHACEVPQLPCHKTSTQVP
ncbi:hypothetical protein GGQ71_004883 [Rhizobium taibaishanense]|uniref:Uncharacterized protein n=1 Tax=Allorhizobium taibaishanense TaxID=887144 RepID=A0A7W6HSF3_9HYPH|nr:hypothetical protein [Allorhizobium taibaishanense]